MHTRFRREEVTTLRVLLVSDDSTRMSILNDALSALGHQVVACLRSRDMDVQSVKIWAPEMIFVCAAAPTHKLLHDLAMAMTEKSCPVVLFTESSDGDTIRKAIRAGVSSYVIDGMTIARIPAVMEVARARFAEYHTLQRELDRARSQLSDRDLVEEAKRLLVSLRGMDEDAAYAALRRLAMDKNKRLGDVARMVIDAADAFGRDASPPDPVARIRAPRSA